MFCFIGQVLPVLRLLIDWLPTVLLHWSGVVRAGPVAGGQGAEAGAEGAGSATAHTQAQQSLRQVSH